MTTTRWCNDPAITARLRAAVGMLATMPLLLASGASAQVQQALVVDDDQDNHVLTLEVGPLHLPARAQYATPRSAVAAGVFPADAWLNRFEVRVVDSDGRLLIPGLLHHAGLFAPGQREVFSPVMRRIVAFGNETEPIALPGRFGYRVAAGDSVLVIGALANDGEEALEDVYLQIRVSYTRGEHGRNTDVLPLYLDVLPPGHRVFDVPPGESSRSWDWTPALPGRLLALGAHLHQYGVAVILEDVTSGKVIWRGRARYDRNGELVGVSRKVFRRGPVLRTDRVYRITAIYHNPTSEVVRGAMGKIGGLMQVAAGTSLPPADRCDPEYLRDVEVTLNHGHEHEHPGR